MAHAIELGSLEPGESLILKRVDRFAQTGSLLSGKVSRKRPVATECSSSVGCYNSHLESGPYEIPLQSQGTFGELTCGTF